MENLNKKTVMEKINFATHPLSMLVSIGHEEEMRLACQVQVNGDITVETHPSINWNGENFWQKPYPNK
jgi:ferredoxin